MEIELAYAPVVKKPALSWKLSREAKQGLSALLLGLLLLIQSMVALPGLHRLFHYDAASPAHQCAVTMLALGQVNCSTTEVCVAPPSCPLAQSARMPEASFVSTDIQLQPSRGPPQGSVLPS
jgi:hypothetical protein